MYLTEQQVTDMVDRLMVGEDILDREYARWFLSLLCKRTPNGMRSIAVPIARRLMGLRGWTEYLTYDRLIDYCTKRAWLLRLLDLPTDKLGGLDPQADIMVAWMWGLYHELWGDAAVPIHCAVNAYVPQQR